MDLHLECTPGSETIALNGSLWVDVFFPTVEGDNIVVTNYTGYTPDGKKDGEPDRATGVVKLSWDDASAGFAIDWTRPQIQMSGVPTISAGSGLVYSSGSESDRVTYFYGLDLATGETVVRERLGPSFDTDGQSAIFDAGNSTLVSDDGSAIVAGGESLIRIRNAAR